MRLLDSSVDDGDLLVALCRIEDQDVSKAVVLSRSYIAN